MLAIPVTFSCLIFFKPTASSFIISHFDLSESNLDLDSIRYMYYNLNKLLSESCSLFHLESIIQFLTRGSIFINDSPIHTENTLMEKVNDFLNDMDTPAKKDTSDVFIEDADMDSDSSNNEISLLSAKIAAKTLRAEDMKKGNVPFPRLCQGSFSGGIVCLIYLRETYLLFLAFTTSIHDSICLSYIIKQISTAGTSISKVCNIS